ncbi:MAG: PEP-CTERM sorting domain-containing protein [Nitrospirota bacterium]
MDPYNVQLIVGQYTSYPSYGSFHVTPIPEPGTLMLMGSGLLGAGLYGWRRIRK